MGAGMELHFGDENAHRNASGQETPPAIDTTRGTLLCIYDGTIWYTKRETRSTTQDFGAMLASFRTDSPDWSPCAVAYLVSAGVPLSAIPRTPGQWADLGTYHKEQAKTHIEYTLTLLHTEAQKHLDLARGFDSKHAPINAHYQKRRAQEILRTIMTLERML